jgi:ABC-type Co2+ transport system permease subunit
VPLAIAEGFLTVIVMNALSAKTHVLEELGLVREQMS